MWIAAQGLGMLLGGSCCVWELLLVLVATRCQSWHGRGDSTWTLMRVVIITACTGSVLCVTLQKLPAFKTQQSPRQNPEPSPWAGCLSSSGSVGAVAPWHRGCCATAGHTQPLQHRQSFAPGHSSASWPHTGAAVCLTAAFCVLPLPPWP